MMHGVQYMVLCMVYYALCAGKVQGRCMVGTSNTVLA